MIEVLKDGRPRYEVTCKFCNSELRYVKNDVREDKTGRSHYGYDMEMCGNVYAEEFIEYIICPVCGKVITLNKKWKYY